ncbi:MAG TPA: glycoside hydrolase family 11 protein [Polyangia bacterium]
MRSRHGRSGWSLGPVAACLAAAALGGCSSSGAGGGEGGTGGPSSGGSIGSGGATSGGATSGSGGATGGSGGSSGAGGRGGSGGTAVSTGGGAGNNGGAAGSGGTAGTTSAAGGSAGRGSGGAGAGGATGTGGARGGATGTGGAGGARGAGGATGTGGAAGGGGSSGGAGGASSSCPAATPPTGGKQYCTSSKGTADGSYAYELWSNGTGSGCMTVYGVDATFSATWTGVGDLLARNGLQFDETKTPTQLGTISSDFAETKTGNSGLVYVGIYGWTVNPLREYYILDDWGDTMPGGTASDGTARTHVGTITVDGGTYDVWKHTQLNKPNITGTDQNFDQYFSVRQTARQCGHISISQHFSQWTTLGLQLGNLEEAKVLVEAQSSTGTIAFTTATVVVK